MYRPFAKRSMRSMATSMQPSKPMHSICRAACNIGSRLYTLYFPVLVSLMITSHIA